MHTTLPAWVLEKTSLLAFVRKVCIYGGKKKKKKEFSEKSHKTLICAYSYFFLPIISNGEGNGTPLQYSCLENPWTEEPGRLQSMGSLRVRHD